MRFEPLLVLVNLLKRQIKPSIGNRPMSWPIFFDIIPHSLTETAKQSTLQQRCQTRCVSLAQCDTRRQEQQMQRFEIHAIVKVWGPLDKMPDGSFSAAMSHCLLEVAP
jgi:hypothetical protein